MATKSNVRLEILSNNPLDVIKLPVASATVLAVGDLLKGYTSDCVVAVSAANDSDAFVGLSNSLSRSGDTMDVEVLIRVIASVTLSSSTALDAGDGLIYVAGANGTDWTFNVDTSGTNILAWAFEMQNTAGTGPVSVLFDSYMLSAGRASGDGFWEASAT